MFKHNFKRYFIRYPDNGTEFWAYSETNESDFHYLGKLSNNQIHMANNFRTLPWDVQKGAGRLFRIFLHNDWREL